MQLALAAVLVVAPLTVVLAEQQLLLEQHLLEVADMVMLEQVERQLPRGPQQAQPTMVVLLVGLHITFLAVRVAQVKLILNIGYRR
jgi:hypothetical protein